MDSVSIRVPTNSALISSGDLENVTDRLSSVKHNDLAAEDHPFPFAGQPRQLHFACFWQGLHAFLQAWRQRAIALKVLLEPGR